MRFRISSRRFSSSEDSSLMAETIEERHRNLYTAVGIALSRWNKVEWELAGLFSLCVAFQPDVSLRYAYWSVLAFDAKLKMSDAVIRRRFRYLPEYLSQWTKA